MKKASKSAILSFVFFAAVTADAKVLTVKQINHKEDVISLTTSDASSFRVGERLNIAQDGVECMVVVDEIQGNKVIADAGEKDCPDLKKVKAGMVFNESDFDVSESKNVKHQEAQKKAQTFKMAEWTQQDEDSISHGTRSGFQIFGGFNLANELESESSDLESDFAFNFGGRYQGAFDKNIGFNVGAGYELTRDLESTGFDRKLGFVLLESNITMDFYGAYGFMGINYPLITEDNDFVDLDATWGVQVGMGMKFAPKFSGEVLYRTVNFNWSNEDYTRLWGLGLRAVYTF